MFTGVAGMTFDLLVDWPACRARGLCSEMLPEVVQLDEWGYPVVTGPVSQSQLRDARSAIRACPQLALRLERTR
jgi:ferredoxin